MKRRNFLQTLGATAPAALAGSAAPSTAAPSPATEPQVFFYDDGRHASGLYQFAPPLAPGDLTFAVDQLVSSGVDTLIYSAGLEGGVVQYDSRIGQKWGDNADVWSHPIFYRAARNLKQLIADGHDPMNILCDRAHEKALWFIPTLPLCIVGGKRSEDLGYGRKSDFVYDHPEYYVGPDNHPNARHLGRFFGPTRLSFLRPEVREERFRLFEELLSRYETDGVEVDLSIDNEFGPFCRFEDVPRLAPVLTEWLGKLRQAADRAQREQNRRKRIYVRIPAGGEAVWKIPGFEVPRWVSGRLVDGLICITASKKETPSASRLLLDQDLDLRPAVGLAKGSDCRVLMGFRGNLGRQLETSATAPMIHAAASLAYEQGVDGFGLCDGMWAPNGWPWTDEDYEALRPLGHPDMLATADKHYLAPSLAHGATSTEGLFPVVGPILPQALGEGKPLAVKIRVADDLTRWGAEGRVESVRLSVRLTNIELDLDEVEIRWNGRPLSDARRRESDLHFRVLENTIVNPYGYVFEYDLTPEQYPAQGENTVAVTLIKRDPNIDAAVEIYDVDINITYRLHRHFQSRAIRF
ncbi:MAG: hypothetical protein O2968_16075 [Acidobacteria bacterium]|nr:hypothetical protein [Acidobacteriota bacterium]